MQRTGLLLAAALFLCGCAVETGEPVPQKTEEPMPSAVTETTNEYDALIADMEIRINAVQDGDARDLLRKRYLEFLPWSEIMKEMGYSKSHVFRLHSTAVAALKSWDTVGLANTGNV